MIFAFLARGFMTGAIKKCSFAKTYFFCLVFVLVYLLFHPYPQTIHVHYVNYHQCMSKDKRTILMSIFIFNSLLFCILLCTSYLLSALSPLSAYSAQNCCLICFWPALFTYFYHPHIIIIYRSSLNVSQKQCWDSLLLRKHVSSYQKLEHHDFFTLLVVYMSTVTLLHLEWWLPGHRLLGRENFQQLRPTSEPILGFDKTVIVVC